jgi:hypothetical protein
MQKGHSHLQSGVPFFIAFRNKEQSMLAGRARIIPLSLLLFASVAVPLACKPADKNEVSGTVKYKGQPLPGGIIFFQSEDGTKESSAINRDGQYAFVKMKPGKFKIYIETPSKPRMGGTGGSGGGPPGGPPRGGSGPPKDAKFGPPGGLPPGVDPGTFDPKNMEAASVPEIPARYKSADTSGLTADVKSGKNTGINFDLTD